MRPGLLFANRFELERMAGSGGMGAIWRAVDQTTGEPIALKVLLHTSDDQITRFRREARAVADLRHPAIARHIAHGTAEDGRQYLAIEWLDGEDLEGRLARGPLDIEESLDLMERVAEALGVIHAHGIIHRDLKPANLFLIAGDPAQVKILDFGIARSAHASFGLTNPGAVMGTPAYMAPEQVRGEPCVDERADIYALGGVLFACLTGRPPFTAEHPMAIFAKVLLDHAPRPSTLRPGLPARVDALVARLLAKEPLDRPQSAAEAIEEIQACRAGRPDAARRQSSMPPALTASERRLVSVVLAAPVNQQIAPPAATPTLSSPVSDGVTLEVRHGSTTPRQELPAEFHRTAERHGARLEVLQDGSVVAMMLGTSTPADLARNAARCALAVEQLLSGARIALASDWDIVEDSHPVGRVIDLAAALLAGRAATPSAPGSILLDARTASLLGTSFEICTDDHGHTLVDEREPLDEARTLLGKPSPFLGRDRELRILEELFDECASEPRAQTILVTGAPGVGKSRLQNELVRRLSGRSESMQVWRARGDPLRAGAPLGLLGQLVRSAAAIQGDEPPESRKHKLATLVGRGSLSPASQVHVAAFLGEFAGAPMEDADRIELSVARHDPQLMAEQVRRAWIELIDDKCRRHPVLLVLDDIQWGDRATVEHLDATLGRLRERPLMMIALARPEVREIFPTLWAEREALELRLGELPRRTCERLVRAALGPDVTDERVSRLATRSSGNPFFLEELVRASAEGMGEDQAPDTVLAMVQSRLMAVDPTTRRVLRAASVLGEVFWRGALARLVGELPPPQTLDAALVELERREIIARQSDSRFRVELEFSFRHGMVRDAAYGMLTGADRRLGHELAGGWLEELGEADAMVVARHYDLGDLRDRAALWYCRAAEQALRANDLTAVRARTERGIACGATGALLGELHLLRAEALRWGGEYAEAERSGLEAVNVLPTGGRRWCAAATELAGVAGRLGHIDLVRDLAHTMEERWSDTEVEGAQIILMAQIAVILLFKGLYDPAAALCARVDEVAERYRHDPTVYMATLRVRALRALFSGDYHDAYTMYSELASWQERAEYRRRACQYRTTAGWLAGELGAYEESIEQLQAALREAESLNIPMIVGLAKGNLGIALAIRGAFAEARTVTEEAIAFHIETADRRVEATLRANLARILLLAGDSAEAIRQARLAADALVVAPPLRPHALAVLGEALLARGHADEALAVASQAAEAIRSLRLVEKGESLVRLIYAEALAAAGQMEPARAAIAAARERLLERAARIPDASWRERFLQGVPENATTLARARAWLDAEPPSSVRSPAEPDAG